MEPYTLLHAGPRVFLQDTRLPIRCYKTRKGFMETWTFYRIMKDVFIPFVNETRRRHNLVGKPAALVVDGHISRFSLETALLLINEGIHLIVIPAHSSNVLQPLDLGLNSLIKRFFRDAFRRLTPVIPLQEKDFVKRSPGRPSKKKPRRDDAERLLLENECLLRARQEEPEETVARVGQAAYERAKVATCAVEALQMALTCAKIKKRLEHFPHLSAVRQSSFHR